MMMMMMMAASRRPRGPGRSDEGSQSGKVLTDLGGAFLRMDTQPLSGYKALFGNFFFSLSFSSSFFSFHILYEYEFAPCFRIPIVSHLKHVLYYIIRCTSMCDYNITAADVGEIRLAWRGQLITYTERAGRGHQHQACTHLAPR